MSTPYIALCPPPGPITARASDPTFPPTHLPSVFIDALAVRQTVFVAEQRCSLDNEMDADDSRSWHWTLYSKISTTKLENDIPEESRRKSHQIDCGNLPVGTVRLVPPPHAPHPQPGSSDGIGGQAESVTKVAAEKNGMNRATQDGEEPYIKLGRLAVLKECRGSGFGKVLVDTAIEWVIKHKSHINRQRKRGIGEGNTWKGLILVHAQKRAVKFYETLGWRADEGLGTWLEEGIEHIGMWRRLNPENDLG